MEIIGADEGIRTLDPDLGNIRFDEISTINHIFIKLLKNPNTIRTFLKAVRLECFVLNVLAVAAECWTIPRASFETAQYAPLEALFFFYLI